MRLERAPAGPGSGVEGPVGAQVEHGRRQVLDAATRGPLRKVSGYSALALDVVATRAHVARGTVYFQFGSKTGLLEAACDDLGRAGRLDELAQELVRPDRPAAPASFVACFGRSWQADRIVMRRLRALASLDAGKRRGGHPATPSASMAADVLVQGLPADVGQPATLGRRDPFQRVPGAARNPHRQAGRALSPAGDRGPATMAADGILSDLFGELVGQAGAISEADVLGVEVHVGSDRPWGDLSVAGHGCRDGA